MSTILNSPPIRREVALLRDARLLSLGVDHHSSDSLPIPFHLRTSPRPAHWGTEGLIAQKTSLNNQQFEAPAAAVLKCRGAGLARGDEIMNKSHLINTCPLYLSNSEFVFFTQRKRRRSNHRGRHCGRQPRNPWTWGEQGVTCTKHGEAPTKKLYTFGGHTAAVLSLLSERSHCFSFLVCGYSSHKRATRWRKGPSSDHRTRGSDCHLHRRNSTAKSTTPCGGKWWQTVRLPLTGFQRSSGMAWPGQTNCSLSAAGSKGIPRASWALLQFESAAGSCARAFPQKSRVCPHQEIH